MRLACVRYELFESDVDAIASNPHTIDREIHLIGQSGESLFISWANRPVQYCIGVADSTFFKSPAPALRDMTYSGAWGSLIGASLELRFLDDAHQLLEVRAEGGVVYCASLEESHWRTDVVRVSSNHPGMPNWD